MLKTNYSLNSRRENIYHRDRRLDLQTSYFSKQKHGNIKPATYNNCLQHIDDKAVHRERELDCGFGLLRDDFSRILVWKACAGGPSFDNQRLGWLQLS